MKAALFVIVSFFTYYSSQTAGGAADADRFDLRIVRDETSAKATLGTLSVNGAFLCYTLEPPVGGGPAGKGPIPKGTYDGSLRYDKADRWRIELRGVPGFDGVQIHIGNYPKDTAGCILVGLKRDVKKGEVSDSQAAYRALKKSFYGTESPNQTPNKPIRVEISG